jgi:hypothetical protein
MANLRDPHGYLIMDEKRAGLTKKKFFVAKEARALQSRINLKFPEMENKNQRTTEDLKNIRKNDLKEIEMKEGNTPLKEFEKQYHQKLNLEKMVMRNRMVSN